MNKVILVGNVGQDPEVKTTSGGKSVVNFSIATRDGKDETTWHRIIAFEKLADLVGEYVTKGQQVAVVGRLKYGKYKNKDGVEVNTTDIVANEIEFGPRKDAAPADEAF